MDDLNPHARVVADSISAFGDRLTTIEVTLHRFVHAELMTHRTFSRNSASSRAIPVSRMMAKVANTPAVPLTWTSEQRGMQGGRPLPAHTAHTARRVWLAARDAAVQHAEQLTALGVHKSIVNRLLEPFLPHTVIVTATDWTGFWEQRCSHAGQQILAQAEIVAAADAMRAAYDTSHPASVPLGGWHLPYLADWENATLPVEQAKQVSAARCARVSYLNHAGQRDLHADLALYQRLVTARPPHASPLEHVATPAEPTEPVRGNFSGWHQLRHHMSLTGA